MTIYTSCEPLLLQLDAAAKVETDELVKFNLKLCKDELWQTIRDFEAKATGDNLAAIVGKWSHAMRVLGFTKMAA